MINKTLRKKDHFSCEVSNFLVCLYNYFFHYRFNDIWTLAEREIVKAITYLKSRESEYQKEVIRTESDILR